MARPPSRLPQPKKDENWVELSNTLSLPNKCIFMRNFQTTASNSGSLKGGHESRLWPNIAAALGPRGPIQLLGPPIHKGYSLHAQWQLESKYRQASFVEKFRFAECAFEEILQDMALGEAAEWMRLTWDNCSRVQCPPPRMRLTWMRLICPPPPQVGWG